MAAVEPIAYSGLVVTSILLGLNGKTFEDLKDGDEVTFTESDKNGSHVAFLQDIVQDTTKSLAKYEREFKAKFVSPTKAAEIASRGFDEATEDCESTPLFCVHGFNKEPGTLFEELKDKAGIFEDKDVGNKKYYPIPVIWPCAGVMTGESWYGYGIDQHTGSQNAGKGLTAFVNGIPNGTFPRKSLLMHSMGNHVVFNGACGVGAPDVQFENIFMVAADLPFDVFHKDPNENYVVPKNKDVFGNKKLKADRFVAMLATDPDGKPKGKVYVLHNYWDMALIASSNVENWETRLGSVGNGAIKVWLGTKWSTDYDKQVPEKFHAITENWDCTSENHDGIKHSYHFETWAIKHYSSKALSSSGEFASASDDDERNWVERLVPFLKELYYKLSVC